MSTKINAMVDHRGLPVAITFSPRQDSDKVAVVERLSAHSAPGDVVADRGYDARPSSTSSQLMAGGGIFPQSAKVQRSVDAALYRQRNLVERIFNKLSYFRKVAPRYGKTARNDLAAVQLASSRVWLRFYESLS
ncbi:transposase [Seohaeicola zhoushanensis]|uniref:transposase n=1 Tax=Seohaeicola zhoushanensis TaxID=1569283 RepID=UPI0016726465|nr:transposase [Seohaeicola zhoushanensis]